MRAAAAACRRSLIEMFITCYTLIIIIIISSTVVVCVCVVGVWVCMCVCVCILVTCDKHLTVHSVHCSFKLFAAAVKKAAAAAAAAAAQAERQQQWQLHRTAAMKARSSQDQLQELVVVYTCSCATFIALNMNKICYCSRTPPIARVHHPHQATGVG